jgi:hypothetical protein
MYDKVKIEVSAFDLVYNIEIKRLKIIYDNCCPVMCDNFKKSKFPHSICGT